MKNIIFLILTIFFCIGCDPSESMEVLITNNTDKNFTLYFDSKTDSFDKQLEMEANTTRELFNFRALGGVYITFQDYDSIYIESPSNEILKVYKENTPGKNIYDVKKYWSVSEPSKDHFIYKYHIEDEDFK